MKKEAGHIFLAKLGKKRLRPGGKVATEFLFQQGKFSNKTRVLEVACNMCTTSIELVKRYGCSIDALDLDVNALEKARFNIEKENLKQFITLHQGNASDLPFEDNQFDIVINEAMLTMLSDDMKIQCLKEYYRVLKPNGILLTHDIMLSNENHNLKTDLSRGIATRVAPHTKKGWFGCLESTRFEIIDVNQGKMSLMSPIGLIKDEGMFNTLKIVKNGLKKENREKFLSMFKLFRKNKNNLGYIAISSRKVK